MIYLGIFITKPKSLSRAWESVTTLKKKQISQFNWQRPLRGWGLANNRPASTWY